MALDKPAAKAIAARAHHIREKDRVTKALKVMARFPCLTLRGADRHHLLNGDVFDEITFTDKPKIGKTGVTLQMPGEEPVRIGEYDYDAERFEYNEAGKALGLGAKKETEAAE